MAAPLSNQPHALPAKLGPSEQSNIIMIKCLVEQQLWLPMSISENQPPERLLTAQIWRMGEACNSAKTTVDTGNKYVFLKPSAKVCAGRFRIGRLSIIRTMPVIFVMSNRSRST